MNTYLLLKIIHLFSVVLSISLFSLRSYWLIEKSPILEKRLIKILPHLIDSILLISAFSMIFVGNITIDENNYWVITKIIAVIVYILIGLYIFKIAKQNYQIYIALVFVMFIYYYIIQTAITKSIIPILF